MARPKSTDRLSKRAQLQFLRAFDAVRKGRKPMMTVETLAEQMGYSASSVYHSLERDKPLRRLRAVKLFHALRPTIEEKRRAATICPWLHDSVIGELIRAETEKFPPLCVPNGDFAGLAEFIAAEIYSTPKARVKISAPLSAKLRAAHRHTAERFADYSWSAAEAVVKWAETDTFFRGYFGPDKRLDIEQVAIVLQALAHANEKRLPHSPRRMLAKP